jgi:hypothetical protein
LPLTVVTREVGYRYLYRLKPPLPPAVMNKSRFCGRWRESQMVDLCAFSVRQAKPSSGCCVRMSYTRNLDSSVVTACVGAAVA